MTSPAPRPTVEPTSLRMVVVALLAGASIAWLLLSALEAFGEPAVDLGGWTTPVLLLAAGVAGFGLAWYVRQRNHVLRRPMASQRAFLTLVLGKTMLLAGALLVGAYATIALRNLPRWSVPGPQQRVIIGAAVAVASALVGLSGWLVERACRIPPKDEDKQQEEPKA